MKNFDWFSRLTHEYRSCTMTQRVAGGLGVALLLLTTGVAVGQSAAASDASPGAAQEQQQDGYAIHQTADLGGHMSGVSGSGAMYDTLVNIQSGPRVLGQTFTMHALPGTKHPLLDDLTAFSNGFGGDPDEYNTLNFSKGKLYEFSGVFRRDRQYFDYDLLGNALIPGGQSVPIGPAGSLGSYAWPQMNDSPFKFNTVRRMTDTNLTVFPLSKITLRAAYSQNVFQGPTLSPGGIGLTEGEGVTGMLLQEFMRNSTDDFIGGIDWKPYAETKITFEEEVTHFKENSYYTLDPSTLTVQESNGLPVSLGGYNSTAPYAATNCSPSVATPGVVLTSASGSSGLPVVDPACNVNASYARYQPTRLLYPTEILRFQSSSIRNIEANGSFRYTEARSNLPNYYDSWQGQYYVPASGSKPASDIRTETFTGWSSAKRHDVGAEFGITWQAMKNFSLSDQIYFSNVHEPGRTDIAGAESTEATATAPGYGTINYAGTFTPATATFVGNSNGVLSFGYFGQKILTNNATATWDASSRATLSLTYRYGSNTIVQGAAISSNPANESLTIFENGGILNVAVRPTEHWDINGTVEAIYDNNVLTPIDPRQTQHYRIHTLYRPRPWATISAAYNDRERRNNTNNSGDWSKQAGGVFLGPDLPPTTAGAAAGPLDHVDHSRVLSVGAVLAPNEHYEFDVNYSYSDVYTATNICYDASSSATLPGAATASGTACPGATVRGTTYYEFGPVKDFMDAPTQYASIGLMYVPNKSLHTGAGYRISAVSGNQFFNDAQAVNGSLQSAYQTPYLNVAWTVRPGWIWKAEYDYYGYGEGGPSGAPYCSENNPTPTAPATVLSCAAAGLPGPTGLTESPAGLSAPRNFHANNVTLAMHYEF